MSEVQVNGAESRALATGFGSEAQIELSEGGAIQVWARQRYEIEGAIIAAQKWPRDEETAAARLMTACESASMAEAGLYIYERAGQSIVGISVALAREARRLWGHMRSGVRVLSIDDEFAHVEGWAYDVQTGAHDSREAKVRLAVPRRGGVKVLDPVKDERDVAELVNRVGSKLERNAINHLMPAWLLNDAKAQCLETQRKKAEGELKANRPAYIRRMIRDGMRFGVTRKILERKIGKQLDVAESEDFVLLASALRSVLDGESRVSDVFDMRGDDDGSEPQAPKSRVEALNEQLAETDPPVEPDEVPVDAPKTSPSSPKKTSKGEILNAIMAEAQRLGMTTQQLLQIPSQRVTSLSELRVPTLQALLKKLVAATPDDAAAEPDPLVRLRQVAEAGGVSEKGLLIDCKAILKRDVAALEDLSPDEIERVIAEYAADAADDQEVAP